MAQNIDFNRKQKIHFIGIGGISMSAIAQVLLSRGFEVTGSDSKASGLTAQLQQEGATVFIGQSGDNIAPDTDMVVYTAAISEENPELKKARALEIPCVTRAEFLGQMMKNYETSVCVAGTHGKTTTTSMLSEIMLDAGTDPTIMVGGIMPSIHGNTRIGASGHFITEACEYTNSFLSFFPTLAVILNVKEDHMDFFKDLADIRHSFREFAHLLPDDGVLVINGEIEDPEYFTGGLNCRIITFGESEGCEVRAQEITYNQEACPQFDLYLKGERIGRVSLKVPGEHNVYNALAAIASAYGMGLDVRAAMQCVSGFSGVDRRFQYKGQIRGITVIDDYAHHPDEIEATLNAALKIPHRKLWVVFQPHTYSRTEAFMDDFAKQLSRSDAVILAEIYAAREKNIHGTSSRELMEKIRSLGTECYYFPTFDEIENFLLENCSSGDVFITMGAGDVVLIGDFILGN
ncbi:MAG: UDP-N-acetylmuramate--L-alanine ligase [Parasporobacterium sp.]|nr:UDP-N-acetylmuramate--L-alanine ligase [Parasporobacterium sp.]